MKATQEVVTLRARVEALEGLCGAIYQFAGAVGAPERILDALWAAAQGEAFEADGLLPTLASECHEIIALQRQLDDVRKIVSIGPAAAEFGRLGGSRTSMAKQRASAANGRKGGRPRKRAVAAT
jgi:hypothetical protein